MALSVGIVGLPNVGKSTLFNAITNSAVEAANYPFCTIEPNIGIVAIPDLRLDALKQISGSEKILNSTIEFVDIAGLVKGASKGEGLGNKFLAHIRSVAAIAHVVRCFEDKNITHVSDVIDPVSDAQTINLELILADMEIAEKAVSNQGKKAKTGNKEEIKKLELLTRIQHQLADEKPVRQLNFNAEETELLRDYQFLTSKKVIYVANIAESEIGKTNAYTEKLRDYARQSGDEFLIISAKIEQELSQLPPEERKEYLAELGLPESGLSQLSKACFKLLDLQTYLTTGPKETRSWTIHKGDTAPKAAGVIHTDFEKGFIRANVLAFDQFVACQGWKNARDKGLLRQEGKEYVMQDGDVVEFLFNV